MPEITTKKAPKKPTARSRITNGSLGDMDGRGKWARRLADLIELYSLDVTDTPSLLPHSTQSRIRRAATLTVELERAEAIYAKDGQAKAGDLEAYQRTANTLTRLLAAVETRHGTVGLTRPPAGAVPYHGAGRLIQEPYSAYTTSGEANASSRYLARAVMFAIETAKIKGSPLPDELAAFAVNNGLADYADDQTEANTLDLTASVIRSANDNAGGTSADD
ncbi:hypothetical protein [Rhizobium sp. 21-4511-3d]